MRKKSTRVWERRCITVWQMQTPLHLLPKDNAGRIAATGAISPKQLRYQNRICEKCLAILKEGSEDRIPEIETCDCVLDPEDGSTIEACGLHPNGGSPRSKKWAAEWAEKAGRR